MCWHHVAGNICRNMQSIMLKRSHRDGLSSQSSGAGGQSVKLLGVSKAVSMLCRQVQIWGPKEAAGRSHGVGWTRAILVSKGHSSQGLHYSMPHPSNKTVLALLCCVAAVLGPERLPLPNKLDPTGLAVTPGQWHHPVESGQCYEIQFN